MKIRFKSDVGQRSLKNTFKMPFKSVKKRKSSPKAPVVALKSATMESDPERSPPKPPPYASLLQLSSVAKDAFRHPPHLAGVLDSLQQLLHASRGGLPPPPSSAGLRHSADLRIRLPTGLPNLILWALLAPSCTLLGHSWTLLGRSWDALGRLLDEFCAVLERFLHSCWSKFAEFCILGMIFTKFISISTDF